MRAELPILSFTLVAFLTFIVSLNLKRSSVANLTLVGWLLVCNLLHAINSVIWANNVAIQVPAWCDIVTKILLGSNVALPGACLCLLRNLYETSSTREATPSKRNCRMFDATICIILPIVYVCLHFFVQDRRFDIVEDFGCRAAIYPSTVAIILMWIPPLFLCMIAFAYFGFIFFNTYCHRAKLSQHLPTGDTPLTTRSLICQFSCFGIQTSILMALFIYSMAAEAAFDFQPWPSWSAIHAQFSAIDTMSLSSLSDVERVWIELTWWIIPVLSFVYIVFFVAGETGQTKRHSVPIWVRRFVFKEMDSGTAVIASSNAKSQPIISMSTISPVHLPSFWDDASDAKLHRQSQRSPPKRKDVKPEDYSPPNSPDVDNSFKQATLMYVGSPAGRRALDVETTDLPRIVTVLPPDSDAPRDSDVTREIAVDVNRASPLLSTTWPLPPTANPPNPSPTNAINSHMPSLSQTSQKSFSGYLDEDIQPIHMRDVPFRGSDVPTTPPATPTPPTPGKSILKPVKKRTSSGSIRRIADCREGNYGLRPEDVIYMTVVKEISV